MNKIIKVLASMMITCEEATMLISMRENARISFFQRLHLELHLLVCKPCRNFDAQNKTISAIVNKVKTENFHSKPNTLSNSKKEQIQEEIQNYLEKKR